jgi:drug/metabolite transporter (DMT)-like permease
MEPLVFGAVLAAAALHAGWNAVVKVGLDRFSSVMLLSMVQSGLALVLLPFFALPAGPAWGWIAVSALLHSGYKIFLIAAYEHGDLSQVYPLARGTAPLVVAVVGALALGEAVTAVKAAAVGAIGLGVVLMSLKGGAGFGAIAPKALLYALGTAAFTAAYTLVDGVGARLSGSASGFTLAMFVGDGLGMLAYGAARRGPDALRQLLPAWRSGLTAGAMSLGSYWVAIWAFTQAPLALVAALRETSVLFAMLIAVVFLKEEAGPWRWAAAALIGAGVMLMRVG